jgi:sterol desaturase/sphingolipid hydroxylase (fatty acid hydroxylase superfamily)
MFSLYKGLNPSKNIRLFKNPVLEQFTYVHPILPALIFVPLVAWCLGWATDLPPQARFTAWLAGLAIWTITEYTLHRFVFHFPAKSRAGKYLVFLFHGIHHDDPEDARRLVMPPVVSITLSYAFYRLFGLVIQPDFLPPFFGGFITGYLCYDYIHYGVHHFTPRTPLGKFLKQYHMLHHFVTPGARFGVSSPLWDVIVEASPLRPPRPQKARKGV